MRRSRARISPAEVLRRELEAIALRFARSVIDAVYRAPVDDLADALEGAPARPRPRSPRPARPRSAPKRRARAQKPSPDALAERIEQAAHAVAEAPDGLSADALRATLGVDRRTFDVVVDALLEGDMVTRQGEGSAITFVTASG